jgi:hypothetical protein
MPLIRSSISHFSGGRSFARLFGLQVNVHANVHGARFIIISFQSMLASLKGPMDAVANAKWFSSKGHTERAHGIPRSIWVL